MAIDPEDLDLARLLVTHSFLERGEDEPPFQLASGRTSRSYFECQATTSRAVALPHLGRAFWRRLLPSVRAVGGLARGADPIALAVACFSAATKRPVDAFSVRKEPKSHGTGRWIEGVAPEGGSACVVDDALTSGGSVLRAVERCLTEGLDVAQVLVLVDREEGGMEALRARLGPGVEAGAIFRRADLETLRGA